MVAETAITACAQGNRCQGIYPAFTAEAKLPAENTRAGLTIT